MFLLEPLLLALLIQLLRSSMSKDRWFLFNPQIRCSANICDSTFIPPGVTEKDCHYSEDVFYNSILLICTAFTLWWRCSVEFHVRIGCSDQIQFPLCNLLPSQCLEIITLFSHASIFHIQEGVTSVCVWLIPLNYIFQLHHSAEMRGSYSFLWLKNTHTFFVHCQLMSS